MADPSPAPNSTPHAEGTQPPLLTKQWALKPHPPLDAVRRLAATLGVDEILATILLQRGIEDYESARSFFNPDWADLHSPWQMLGMTPAAERLVQAYHAGERIMVFGDYDVDGTTSVALWRRYLQQLAWPFLSYIPDRYAEGYGISNPGLERAREAGASVVIALDCGIRAHEQAAYAQALGLDLIICDHHTPGASLPDAYAILNPKQPDCPYPFKELPGCGIGYKLMQAVNERLAQPVDLSPFVDLLSLSIACDIVPMTGENRILAALGLQQLREAPSPGLKALMEQAGGERRWVISDLVFFLGPRVNAAGRLKDAHLAAELMSASAADGLDLPHQASVLEQANNTRKQYEEKILREASHQAMAYPDFPDHRSLVLYEPGWHKGVIGIIASKMVEHFHKPSILLCESNGLLTGSARSVPGFNLYEALAACEDLLDKFGGHKYAAGLSLRPEHLAPFRERFEAAVRQRMAPEELYPRLEADAVIELQDLTPKFVRRLDRMAPFGPAHPRPRFVAYNLRPERASIIGRDRAHLRLRLCQGTTCMEAMGFSMAAQWEQLQQAHAGEQLAALFVPAFNTYQGQTSLRLELKDLKPMTAVELG